MKDFRDASCAALGAELYGYLVGRPHDMRPDDADPNELAWSRYRLVPRVLQGHDHVDVTCRLFGQDYAAPIGVGAFAADRLFGEEGVTAIARVCATLGLPLVVSEEAVTPLGQITATHADCWLQLRAAGPLERAIRLTQEAAQAGCRGIVLTVLAPVHPAPGLHPGGVDVAAQVAQRGWATIGASEGVAKLPAFPSWGSSEMRELLTAVHALGMRLVLKGVMHADDARAAQAAGCDGVMVSNIGVRQSYRWAPVAGQLEGIGEVLDDGMALLVDGGIRQAADIIAARVLGAHLSVIVRPVVHALAAGGEEAVHALLRGLIGEVQAICAWMGAASPGAIARDQLIRMD
ncbi:alpha-hydroxy acid oxidase [Caballeronia sp. LZ043]|uniref:alpha-hydroxy acid oxidase n=1 Tax=Caballeronia sp. LZ043 TaxID=3038569 RepID=UPI002864092C|nr:alpha-hydroxy acid oxidase [Caballeronia sp. LZ043]MDR5822249.1 alpha-hydroxy acid oxidase [Caballeronia sp. LZ043]